LKGVDGEFEGKFPILDLNGSGKTTFFRAICDLTDTTSGEIPPVGNFFARGGQTLVDVNLTFAFLIAWTLALTIVDIVLLRKIRGVGVEEIRTA
jgi:ABC-type Mn2+/Zn2+ transport system ATPase subunit